LRIETGVSIEPAKTLIIFDDVQENPKALTSLKYFYENAPGITLLRRDRSWESRCMRTILFPWGKLTS